ncbi:MAG: tetratricopeptide repeat protein [Litorilinea sp.]
MSVSGPAAVPLSQSPLWQKQQDFYTRLGQYAWQGGFVPEYITSNPFIAHAYAQLIWAYWRDGIAADTLDPAHPSYILELGAGSGRFAFLFLTQLAALLDRAGVENAAGAGNPVPRFVYVMTDVAQSNLDAWRANPRLAPFVAAGTLDFARFDARQDTTLTLVHAQTHLTPGALVNPGVVIANYVLDTIPSDLYYVEGGALFERRIALDAPDAPAGDSRQTGPRQTGPQHPGPQNSASEVPTLHHTHHPVAQSDLDTGIRGALLRRHAAELDATVFPLPTAAVDACDRLRALMAGGLLFLIGDKGYMTWPGLQAVGNSPTPVPGLAFHGGGFSVMVNFPALAHYAELTGGVALMPDHEPYRLGVAALLFAAAGGAPDDASSELNSAIWTETRRTFAAQVAEFGPDDFYVMTRALDDQLATLPFAQVMALLRLSRWDPQLMADCLPALMAALDELTPGQWAELHTAIAATVAQDYPSTTRYDLAYGLGRLFFLRGEYEQALLHLRASAAQHAPNAQVLYEMAVCEMEIGEPAAALSTLEAALAVAPTHAAARALAAYLRRKKWKQEG